MKVGILSIGLGNVPAVEGALRRLSVSPARVENQNHLLDITHLIIPGVGAMGEYITRLRAFDMISAIRSFSMDGKILGICLGFQVLFEHSEEGNCDCLGLFKGHVLSLSSFTSISTNVGYSQITQIPNHLTDATSIVPSSRLISSNNASVAESLHEYYFTHSYFVPIVETTQYISRINTLQVTAVASNGINIYGTQFHPELSHSVGRSLIKKFLDS